MPEILEHGGTAPTATFMPPDQSADSLSLGWLPEDPTWTRRLKTADQERDLAAQWAALVVLANTRMDFIRTMRLDRSMQRVFSATPPPGLQSLPIRLAVLGSSTVTHLLPAIRVGALRRNLWVTTYEADYGQYLQELTDPSTNLHQFKPTAILFVLDAYHLLRAADAATGSAQADAILRSILDQLGDCWRLARSTFRCHVIQQTLLPVFQALLGNNEHRLPGSRHRIITQLNAALRDSADSACVDLLAVDTRAAEDGMSRWHDPALWHRAKQEISPAATPLYGDMLGRLLAAHQGRSFKCLVIGLDSTLWSNVIGDDGKQRNVIDQGSAHEEAFVSFLAFAAELRRRGVLLAVSSQHGDANVLAKFEQHKAIQLQRHDIACFSANQDSNAGHIRQIAQRLNIGLESLVFVDNDPFERNLVRRELPMVAVPEVPDDPALIPAFLAAAGYFEGLAVTAEDRQRAQFYPANKG